jgi:phosphoribosylamine-glycine ligase
MTPDGTKLLEYNVRFGDPEAQTLLPMLDKHSDLAEIILACTRQKLRNVHMEFVPKSAVSAVLAAEGYPEKYQTGDEICFDKIPEGENKVSSVDLALVTSDSLLQRKGVLILVKLG